MHVDTDAHHFSFDIHFLFLYDLCHGMSLLVRMVFGLMGFMAQRGPPIQLSNSLIYHSLYP